MAAHTEPTLSPRGQRCCSHILTATLLANRALDDRAGVGRNVRSGLWLLFLRFALLAIAALFLVGHRMSPRLDRPNRSTSGPVAAAACNIFCRRCSPGIGRGETDAFHGD